jgi:hypothetical protein
MEIYLPLSPVIVAATMQDGSAHFGGEEEDLVVYPLFSDLGHGAQHTPCRQ